MKNKFLLWVLLSLCQVSFSQTKLDTVVDQYFADKKVSWKHIESSFYNQLSDWGYDMLSHSIPQSYHNFFRDYRTMVKPINRTPGTDSLVDQLNRLGGFHAKPPYYDMEGRSLVNIWWDSLMTAGEARGFLDENAKGMFGYLKRRSVEGGVGPLEIAEAFNLGLSREALQEKSIQQIIVCIIYPFMLPSEAKEIQAKAENEIDSALVSIIGEDIVWKDLMKDFYSYVQQNYPYEKTDVNHPGDHYKFMFRKISKDGKVAKWGHPLLKESLAKSGFIGEHKIDYWMLLNIIKPIYFKYPELVTEFHPLSSAYQISRVVADLKEADSPSGVFESILADGFRVGFSQIDLEKPVYQKIMILHFVEYFFQE